MTNLLEHKAGTVGIVSSYNMCF